MNKFRNKYRIPSARLKNWNYGSAGSYFITICTKNRKHFFGEIENGKMIFTELGKIANDEWEKTIELRRDMNLKRDEFVVMPNHFHCIVTIGKNEWNGRDAMHGVSTGDIGKFGPQSKNVASIIRGFKSAVTTYARKNNIEFDWQERFHDHVIRSQDEYMRISNYIKNNPRKWKG